MSEEELKNNTNFVVGHSLKVKEIEFLKKFIEKNPDSILKYKAKRLIESGKCGKEYISDMREGRGFELYDDTRNRFKNFNVPLEFLDFTSDNRKPTQESYDVSKQLAETNLQIFNSTCGELHGSSNAAKLNSDNVYPILDKDGKSKIHVPNCGKSNNALSIDIVKKLIEDKFVDVSFSTGMSFIRRELYLYSEEEVLKKSFSY